MLCAARATGLGDLRVADDALREARVGVVDVRRLVQLAVEDDRVVPGVPVDRGLVVGVQRAGHRAGVDAAAVVLGLGDRLELLRAVTRELQRHDRLAGLRVDVLGDARLDEIVARQLRRPVRVDDGAVLQRDSRRVLEQVPVLAVLRGAVHAGAGAVVRALAPHRLAVRRDRQDLRVRRLLPVLVRQQQLLLGERAERRIALHELVGDLRLRDVLALDLLRDVLLDGLEEEVALRRALVRLLLRRRQEAVERRQRRRLAGPGHGRRFEVRLEVEHLQLPGGADDLARPWPGR